MYEFPVFTYDVLYVQHELLFLFFINRSLSALVRGHNGVIFLCLNPILSAIFRNSCELNGGPLSLINSFGIPKIENVLSKSGITDFAVKLVKLSTTGYLEYSSIITIK
jgi:hypothetical protein